LKKRRIEVIGHEQGGTIEYPTIGRWGGCKNHIHPHIERLKSERFINEEKREKKIKKGGYRANGLIPKKG